MRNYKKDCSPIKLLALLLAIITVFAAFSLTGCTSDGNEGKDTTIATTAGAPITDPPITNVPDTTVAPDTVAAPDTTKEDTAALPETDAPAIDTPTTLPLEWEADVAVTEYAPPDITDAPETDPPVTEPPVTEPPVTLPPITTAPVTTAPVTTAPVTTAPVTTKVPETTAVTIGGYTVSTFVPTVDPSTLPAYSGEPYTVLNGGKPYFTEKDLTTIAFEVFSPFDELGRTGSAYANVCKELMPTDGKSSAGSYKPTGWHSVKYDNVSGKYLYNRTHLLGWQLTGETSNKYNLITGTKYLNTKGMLPFENMIDDYVDETNNHVLYRVTPVFEGSNLIASGVIMEAYSVEDKGDGISLCIYLYNVQPDILIDYATGESEVISEPDIEPDVTDAPETEPPATEPPATEPPATEPPATEPPATEPPATEPPTVGAVTYVINTNSGKFHEPDCRSAQKISPSNRAETDKDRDTLVSEGYSPCGICKP